MPSPNPEKSEGPPGDEVWRWTRMTNGIVTTVVGFVIFGLGVGYSFAPLEILGALVIAGGGFVLMRALLAPPSE